jgi:hypothetical protein
MSNAKRKRGRPPLDPEHGAMDPKERKRRSRRRRANFVTPPVLIEGLRGVRVHIGGLGGGETARRRERDKANRVWERRADGVLAVESRLSVYGDEAGKLTSILPPGKSGQSFWESMQGSYGTWTFKRELGRINRVTAPYLMPAATGTGVCLLTRPAQRTWSAR